MAAELYALIVLGHRDLYDHLKVSSSAARVPIARGVRQGCRIAPMLWAIATAVLMQRTDKSIRLQWTRDNLTAYADDFHTGERICKCTDLDRSLWCCGTFLAQLVDANFSPRALRPLGRRVMSAKVLTDKFLHFSTPAGRCFDIPIKREHTYLGLVISYHNPSAASVSHRIQAA